MITGNEDGASMLHEHPHSLQHLGYTIPPQADSGWLGEAGPGPSYLDEGSGGPGNDFTNRNTAFLTWNLLHLARMLKDAGGIRDGNQRSLWDRLPVRLRPSPRSTDDCPRVSTWPRVREAPAGARDAFAASLLGDALRPEDPGYDEGARRTPS